jgi:hypothetical protein
MSIQIQAAPQSDDVQKAACAYHFGLASLDTTSAGSYIGREPK